MAEHWEAARVVNEALDELAQPLVIPVWPRWDLLTPKVFKAIEPSLQVVYLPVVKL